MLVFLFEVNPILSIEDTTIFASETSEGYVNSFELKCLTNFEYDLLIDYFIKQTVKEIQLNHSSEAMEMLNQISSKADLFVQNIVTEALKQPDVKLLYLLEFLNQAKLPATTFNGLIDIFTNLNNTKIKEDRYGRVHELPNILNWLDLQYFTRQFFGIQAKLSEIPMTEINSFLSDVQEKTKSVVLNTTYNLLKYDDFNTGKVKFASEHVHFIVESLYNNSTIESLIRTLELLSPFNERTMCMSVIALYDLLENSASPNETFKLMPILKFLGNTRYRSSCLIDKLKLKNGSVFQKIQSDNYFHLKNVHNNEFLYVKQNKAKSNFIIKTISDPDSDRINWKFSSYDHFHSDRILLTIKNENFVSNSLRALPCLVHDNESVVQMENGKYLNNEMMNDAWNIEIDDVTGNRFRIRHDFTKAYLAVDMNPSKNQSNIIMVNELNAENFDSVHWSLEAINEE